MPFPSNLVFFEHCSLDLFLQTCDAGGHHLSEEWNAVWDKGVDSSTREPTTELTGLGVRSIICAWQNEASMYISHIIAV